MSSARHALAASAAVALVGLVMVAPSAAAQPRAITPPVPIELPDPVLPEGTRVDADVSVVLLLTIAKDGTVSEVSVSVPGGAPFDALAAKAATRFRFEPALQDGEPIRVRVPFEYTFYRPPRRRGRVVPARRARRAIEPAPGFVYAGTVVEKGTRSPRAGVPVTLTDKRTGRVYEVLTDEDGEFVFHGLAPGQLVLDIFTGEHAPIRETVRVAANDEATARDAEQRYYLAPGGLSAYRTVVRDKRPPKAATVVDLTEDELTKVPGTFGDPTRVVASLPGVSRSPFGLGYYVVRGAQFDNTGFFIDGHPAVFLYHLLGGPGVIQPELVGRLSFYPGGYPARYGNYAAGVIAIDTKDPPKDRWHLDVEVDLFKAGLLFSVPFDRDETTGEHKGVAAVTIRRSYYDLLLPLINDDLHLAYTDYQGRVSYELSPTVRGTFIALGAIDELSTKDVQTSSGSGTSSTSFSLGFHRLNLRLDVDLSTALTWTNSLAWEYDYTDNRRVADGDDAIDGDLGGWFANHRSYVTWHAAKGLLFEAGVDAIYLNYGAHLKIPAGQPLGDPRPPVFDPVIVSSDVTIPQWNVAPYLSGELEVSPGLRLLPGLRLNLSEYGGGVTPTLDPKLAVRWAAHDQWTLKAMAGLAHQPPGVFQTAEPFGDPSLPPSEATQASLGFEWKPAEDWLISVEGFVQLLDDLPQPSDAVVSDSGSIQRLYWDANLRGRSFGAELMIRRDFGGLFYGWLTYTLSRSERWRGEERGWGAFELDQTHILNLAWTARLGHEWSVGARFQLTSGNPYYPIVDARYDADRDQYIAQYARARSRLPVYHRLDVRLDKRWRFEDWMFELYLDIQNLYNAQNPESPRYSFDYKVKTDGVSLPLLPTIGLRAVF
ncbi:MAG: hypothetical protein CSA66_04250 [Proteobacteria bacterium]|nr:MAG: hypothetical protein CSA66_04250 [Pseudomonadota bacterium]